jgi:hypothetical protein
MTSAPTLATIVDARAVSGSGNAVLADDPGAQKTLRVE